MMMFSLFRPSKKVHLYSIIWNEEYLLPYFFNYYDNVVDRYVFYDDGSTDSTQEILKEHPHVEVRKFPRNIGDSYVLSAKELHDNAWKESRNICDWVIWTAVDEFLVPLRNSLKEYLREMHRKKVTAIPAVGFQMISETRPSNTHIPLYQAVTRGTYWDMMSKLSIFDPNAIQSLDCSPGRHQSHPTGDVVFPENDELLLLHYKYLSFDELFARHKALDRKLGKDDKSKGFGHKYAYDRKKLKKDWDEIFNASVPDVFQEDLEKYQDTLWWRMI